MTTPSISPCYTIRCRHNLVQPFEPFNIVKIHPKHLPSVYISRGLVITPRCHPCVTWSLGDHGLWSIIMSPSSRVEIHGWWSVVTRAASSAINVHWRCWSLTRWCHPRKIIENLGLTHVPNMHIRGILAVLLYSVCSCVRDNSLSLCYRSLVTYQYWQATEFIRPCLELSEPPWPKHDRSTAFLTGEDSEGPWDRRMMNNSRVLLPLENWRF